MTVHEPYSERTDAELAAAVPGSGGRAAVAELYRRHRSAVLAYARLCCRDAHTAEDLASEAFVRTIRAVRAGGGPQGAWRPYLLVVVRRTAAAWASTARMTELCGEPERWTNPSVPLGWSGEESVLRREDSGFALRGFRSLPARWQAVLWYTVVEERPAAAVGALLGLGVSGVGSLAARAREALRAAYLAAHVEASATGEECRRIVMLLVAHVRRAGRPRSKEVDAHLYRCDRCRHALSELTSINRRLASTRAGGRTPWPWTTNEQP
ncbi:sigma-70 family RNA polymerase sigma factor [Streptomyces sp. BPTC-684]|uniref:RNA polymerase sigma factor n=1 Tax=Streptomyces sp. BPTC-684 TaxID=3043734 RepID=UPI0024B09B54|nr:sigma-70 family RNA polymerase sigma factor [Streptomyces sp. BPTC-684]WHM40544.1 sigma-70 family RNA polymerase sigma factor [Streptomyces sp. BPTC-684]